MYTWGSALKELVKENKYEIGLYVLELGTIWALGEAGRAGLNSWMESLGYGPDDIGSNVKLYGSLKWWRDYGIRGSQVGSALIHPIARGLKKGVDYLRQKKQK